MTDDRMLNIAKWSTLIVGILTALAGGSLIGIGIYGLLNPLGSSMVPMTLPIIAIVTGGLLTMISLVGCTGSYAEHKTMLWVFFGLMTALVLLQFVVGIAALSTRGKTIDDLADRRWSYLYENQPRELRRIEEQYQCCGLNYVDDRAWPKSGKRCSENKDFGYTRACLRPVHNEWEHRQKMFAIVVLTLVSLQLLGLIPVFHLVSNLPSAEKREQDLLDEHRRLLESTSTGGYGSRYHDAERPPSSTGGVPIQHPVGGPAGSYPYTGKNFVLI
ncbi:hypothetical protein HDU86_004092 [Geranomyces michiganensis]|nr:hypothetical protein HDU86_004092 [Geranomyces michiganensis]